MLAAPLILAAAEPRNCPPQHRGRGRGYPWAKSVDHHSVTYVLQCTGGPGNVGGTNDFGSSGNPGTTRTNTGGGVGGTNDMGSAGKTGRDETSSGTGPGGVGGTNDMGSAGNDSAHMAHCSSCNLFLRVLLRVQCQVDCRIQALS